MCALTSKQDLYSAAGVCADGHQAAEQQMAASALMEELKTPSVLAQAHSPVSLLQCLAQCFTAKLINEQLIKKSYVGVRRKEKRSEGRRGRKLHTADLIICKV